LVRIEPVPTGFQDQFRMDIFTEENAAQKQLGKIRTDASQICMISLL